MKGLAADLRVLSGVKTPITMPVVPKGQLSPVNEVYIDFVDGEISGNCDGCTAADVADALERIARKLRMMDETPDYIGFDEGEISSAWSGNNDFEKGDDHVEYADPAS